MENTAKPSDLSRDHQPSRELQQLRVRIAEIVGRYFVPLLMLTMLFAFFLIFIIGTTRVTSDTAEKMALAASIQVAFGMFIGYVCVYIGLMMTWFGIEAAYSFTGAVGAHEAKGEVSLRSASPGLIFAVGGMVLIAACLYKPIVYQAAAPIYQTNIPSQPPSGAIPLPTPITPPKPLSPSVSARSLTQPENAASPEN